jgi:hypothetical protein
MKKTEDEDTFGQPWLRKRNGTPKVRKGKVGGFRTELSKEDIVYLNEVFGLDD